MPETSVSWCMKCGRASHGSAPCQPPAGVGVGDVYALAASMQGHQECSAGRHAWTPWLPLPNGSYVTLCGRDGCTAEKQYDL